MRLMRYLTAAAFLIGAAAPLKAEATTISGELISIMCFNENGEKGHGDDHAACALRCAKEGNAVGVLTPDGAVYRLTGPLTANHNEKLQDLIAKKVVATGNVGEDAEGKTIEASKVEPAAK